MKTKLIFLTVLIAAFSAVRAQGPQVPNGNFAIWDTIVLAAPDTVYDSTGTIIDSIVPGQYYLYPDQWATIDDVLGAPLGFSYIDMTDVAPGATASLELITDTLAGQGAQEGTIVSFGSLGTASFLGQGFSFTGVPFIFKPDTLLFSYQYTSSGGADTAGVIISFTYPDSTYTAAIALTSASAWTNVAIPLDNLGLYESGGPTSLIIQFVSSAAQNPVIGSTLHVGNVHFRYAKIFHDHVSVVGPTTFCSGDSVILSARTNAAFSYYQWYLNDEATPVPGANSSYFAAYNTGTYFVLIDSSGFLGKSDTVNVTVNQPPSLSLISVQGNDTTNSFCFPSGAVHLFGSPGGGSYIGTGIVDSTFHPYETGNFVLTYAYTDSNGCSAVTTDTVAVNVCTGITQVAQDINLNIYPNPTSNVINIVSATNLTGCNMQIYDVVGARVSTLELEGFSNTMNVAALANGTYIVKVTGKQNAPVSQSKFTVIR